VTAIRPTPQHPVLTVERQRLVPAPEILGAARNDSWKVTTKFTATLAAVGLFFAIAREVQPPFVLRPHRDESGRNTGPVGLRGEWLVLPACLLWLRVPESRGEGFCAEVERGLLLRSEDGRSSSSAYSSHRRSTGLGGGISLDGYNLNQSFGTLRNPTTNQLTHPFIWTMAFRHPPRPRLLSRGPSTTVTVSFTVRWTPNRGRTSAMELTIDGNCRKMFS